MSQNRMETRFVLGRNEGVKPECICYIIYIIFIPQTDLSVGVLAVLVRGPVVVPLRRLVELPLKVDGNMHTKSMVPSKTQCFLILFHENVDFS